MASITLRIPASVADVTLGQYIEFLALRRRVHEDEKAGHGWLPRRYARHILSVFSGVDPDVLGEVDDSQFQDAFARLGFLSELSSLQPRGEYTGGTFHVGAESFDLPESLDHITAGQYETIEKTLNGSSTFERLHYVLAILTMWSTPNILAQEKELHRRAALFTDLPLNACFDFFFWIPSWIQESVYGYSVLYSRIEDEGDQFLSPRGEFSAKYGVYSFLIEAARSGVFGTLDDVRSARLIEVLNYVAYGRSEFNLAKDEQASEVEA